MRLEPMPTTVAAVLAALVLGLSADAAATGNRTDRPSLKLAGTAPLGVEGRGFAAGEVVRLVAVTAELRGARTAIASAKGLLRIRFELRVSRCAELTVRAVGSLGSRAVLHRGGACTSPKPDRGKP